MVFVSALALVLIISPTSNLCPKYLSGFISKNNDL